MIPVGAQISMMFAFMVFVVLPIIILTTDFSWYYVGVFSCAWSCLGLAIYLCWKEDKDNQKAWSDCMACINLRSDGTGCRKGGTGRTIPFIRVGEKNCPDLIRLV